MKNFIRFNILLLAYLCWHCSSAQTDTVSTEKCTLSFTGIVVDGETGEPLPAAVIYLKEPDKGVASNELGHFKMRSICPGLYEVTCSAFGYKSITQSISLKSNTHRKFILHSDTCSLESIEIALSPRSSETSQTQLSIEGKALDQTKGLALGEVLKTLPGVNAVQTGPTIFKPVIEGMYGNRVLIVDNGIRLEGQQWGAEHAPELDPFIAGKMTVIKGAAGVRYGSDALGGVVLIEPKELKKTPGIGGEINLIGFSNNREGAASGYLDYNVRKIKGLAFRLQGTVKRGGNYKTPDYYLVNTGLKEQNFSWTARYERESTDVEVFYSQFNSTLGIFAASHTGNLTDLEKAINSDVPLQTGGFTYTINRPYQQVLHELTSVKFNHRFSKVGKISFIFARQFNDRAEFDSHRPYSNDLGDAPQAKFKITTHTAQLAFSHYTIKRFSGELGVSIIKQGNTTGGTSNAFIPNFRSMATGFYLIEKWNAENLEIEGGIRYDMKWMEFFRYENNVIVSPDYHFSRLSGMLGSVYTINEHLKWNMNFGTAFRPPTANELFSEGLHHGAARIEEGNANLSPEVSYSVSTSLKYHFRKTYGEITFYNNYVKDYIFLAPQLKFDNTVNDYVPVYRLTIRGAFPLFQYEQVNANFTGMDLTYNDSLSKHVVFSTKLSLLRAYNITSNSYLILTPPANWENGLKYQFNSLGKIKEPYVKLSQLLVFRKSKVEPNQDIKAPPPTYTLLTFEAGTGIPLGKQSMDISVTVYNLLNTRYRDYLDRFRYFADGVGRNVALRVQMKF